MPHCSCRFFGCTKPANALAQTHYQAIKNFDDLGSNPTALIAGNDHNLYGTMSAGGGKGEGAVFKVSKGDRGYPVLHDFTSNRNGEYESSPQGGVGGSASALYGMAKISHTNSFATLFKLSF